jgi:hypothetical protein
VCVRARVRARVYSLSVFFSLSPLTPPSPLPPPFFSLSLYTSSSGSDVILLDEDQNDGEYGEGVGGGGLYTAGVTRTQLGNKGGIGGTGVFGVGEGEWEGLDKNLAIEAQRLLTDEDFKRMGDLHPGLCLCLSLCLCLCLCLSLCVSVSMSVSSSFSTSTISRSAYATCIPSRYGYLHICTPNISIHTCLSPYLYTQYYLHIYTSNISIHIYLSQYYLHIYTSNISIHIYLSQYYLHIYTSNISIHIYLSPYLYTQILSQFLYTQHLNTHIHLSLPPPPAVPNCQRTVLRGSRTCKAILSSAGCFLSFSLFFSSSACLCLVLFLAHARALSRSLYLALAHVCKGKRDLC